MHSAKFGPVACREMLRAPLCVALALLVSAQPELEHPQLAADGLGPLLVQKDGSLRRIANWAELTERERQAAVRAASRRNAKRLADLREAEGESTGGGHRVRRSASLWRRLKAVARFVGRPFRHLVRRSRRGRIDGSSAEPTEGRPAAASEALHPPLDFAPEFVEAVRGGRKRATTRLAAVEPQLAQVRAGHRMRATCDRCDGRGAEAEGAELGLTLLITSVETTPWQLLDDSLAAVEGFRDAQALRHALLGFYPELASQPDTPMTVLHFRREG